MLTVIAVWPSVERPVLHRSHVIGNEIASELVALVDDRPKHAALRLPVDADRIPQSRGEEARVAAGGIDLEDGRAVDLLVHSVLGDVAVRADTDVQARAVAVG